MYNIFVSENAQTISSQLQYLDARIKFLFRLCIVKCKTLTFISLGLYQEKLMRLMSLVEAPRGQFSLKHSLQLQNNQ